MRFEPTHLAWHTEAGRRANNEDFCATALGADGRSALLVVADGMGGHAAGEVASRLAGEWLLNAFSAGQLQTASDANVGEETARARSAAHLKTLVFEAHEAVLSASRADNTRSGMGTTVVAALVLAPEEGENAAVVVAHVGDSRAFQFRAGNVRRLTRDHLFAIDVLGVAENRAKNHPQGNVLSQALGNDGDFEPSVNCFDLRAGDFLLLCSDGVSECVPEPQMNALLGQFFGSAVPDFSSAPLDEANALPLPRAAAALVQRALDNNSRDNCTVALALVPGGANASASEETP